MPDHPDFLPPKFDTDGNFQIVLDNLYILFTNDFKINITRHCSITVDYDRRILPDGDGKEEGFWHVISKTNHNTGEREPDYRRARRLPWARPLMECGKNSEIIVFDYDHGSKDKGIRRYIWLGKYRYAIVLREKKGTYYWVTAYYVNRKGEGDLRRQYSNRVRKTATAL
jgi:hypothetical protein